MSKVGTGEIIYNLRKKIQELQNELEQLGSTPSEIPELIESANLLRMNEFLTESNDKKTELISVYGKYSEALESLLASVFEIQDELKEILKEQSSMLTKPSKPKKPTKTKSKSKK